MVILIVCNALVQQTQLGKAGDRFDTTGICEMKKSVKAKNFYDGK